MLSLTSVRPHEAYWTNETPEERRDALSPYFSRSELETIAIRCRYDVCVSNTFLGGATASGAAWGIHEAS
jgi:hypothetical protein